jgi:hypothetical protein
MVRGHGGRRARIDETSLTLGSVPRAMAVYKEMGSAENSGRIPRA